MAEWEGKSLGTPSGYGFFIFLMNYLGLYPAYLFLYIIVFYYFIFSAKTSRFAYSFYRKRMNFGRVKSVFKIYRNYYLLGQMLIDKVAVMVGFSDKFTSESFGAENLKKLVADKKGGILLGAHLGNWEIAGHFIANYDNKINILLYDAEHKHIKEYLDSVTGGKKFNIIPIKDDISHVYAISDALERNELICMHADRFVNTNRTHHASFMGEDAQFPVGPFQIIKIFKAPYTFVYGIKKKTTHYNFFARPVRYVEPGTTIDSMVTDYAHDLEEMVKQYPEQWFNYFDFWKKPEGYAATVRG